VIFLRDSCFARALYVRTIVPGHGDLASGAFFPPSDSPLGAFVAAVHRWNLATTWREIAASAP